MQSNTSAVLAAEHEPAPSEIERAKLFLEQAQDAAVGAIRGLSAAQWSFRPAPNRWSASEIMEHVILVQERVLGPVREQLAAAPAGPVDRTVDAIVISQFPNRLTKIAAPEALHPKGGFPLPDAIDRLKDNTRRLAQWLNAPGLRQHVLEAMPIKIVTSGAHQVMDGYQWILAAAAHTERHAKQILEVRADANFPQK